MLQLIIALVLSTLLAALAVWKKALTPCATALAWFFAVCITYFGGTGCFVILAATFLFTIAAGKISKKQGLALGKTVHAKPGKRDAVQIICNVGTGTAFLLLSAALGLPRLRCVYACVMAASLADSMASELGVLASGDPVDICTWKHVPRGISGGITVLGTGASLLGSALIGLCSISVTHSPADLLLIILCGFCGALIDSVLGSRFQVKYSCVKCGILTEKTSHCGERTQRVSGMEWMTNDTVNFCNNLFAGVMGCVLFLLVIR